MIPRREIKVLLPILEDPDNTEKDAETLAEELIHALDEERGKSNRLAVIANYRWQMDDKPTLAVFGPFSTRGLSAARAVGERMAGGLQGGSGKWMAVSCYATAKDAWEAIKPPSERDIRMQEITDRIHRFLAWQSQAPRSLFDQWYDSGPSCACGRRDAVWCLVHKKAVHGRGDGRG
ncbi:hypothetical protein [Streptomyces sp. URMC 129]|uniref:hypothetical protein n=1 Tax=Streptomyces sp. URMC 129 TaxID=3423407 RepID=UPI003F1A5AF3